MAGPEAVVLSEQPWVVSVGLGRKDGPIRSQEAKGFRGTSLSVRHTPYMAWYSCYTLILYCNTHMHTKKNRHAHTPTHTYTRKPHTRRITANVPPSSIGSAE